MTHLDEKLTQIHSESFREGRIVRRRGWGWALGALFRIASLGRRR